VLGFASLNPTYALFMCFRVAPRDMSNCYVKDFSTTLTAANGVLVSGSFSGLKDISEPAIQTSSSSETFGAVPSSVTVEVGMPCRQMTSQLPLPHYFQRKA
jgi:hypothetical protein